MEDHDGDIKGFYHLSKAWYGETNLKGSDIKDEITFGYYSPEGGTSGEMSVRWYTLGGDTAPRLEVFNDAWHALSTFTEVIRAMGAVDDQHINPGGFCEILSLLGFKDLTPTENPHGKQEEGLEETPVLELLKIVERLIMHRKLGDLHPVDFQRLEYAVNKVKEIV